MVTREDVAAALSTVAGVTGYAYKPAVTNVGDAWPLLNGWERAADVPLFLMTRRINVVLPADEVAASEWIDAKWEALVDALLPVGYVERIEPINLGSESQPVYGLQILMRSE